MLAYLASPYNDTDPSVMQVRYGEACRVAALMIQRGQHVFSPIAHNVPLINAIGGLTGREVWCGFDRAMLERCDNLFVLRLPGWEASKGVQAEIKIASEIGLHIEYMDA